MKKIKPKMIVSSVFVLLALWVIADLYIPRRRDMRSFDPAYVGKMDSDMWRAYYEKKPVRLFFQLAGLMRRQYHAPFWRAFAIAYRAAKAAFVFKEGHNRAEYGKALPHLEKFYCEINSLSDKPFDYKKVAGLELEWWIIRREPDQFTTADWENILAQEAGEMYLEPAAKFSGYAQSRTEAMVLRDQMGNNIAESDWQKIDSLLVGCWTALHSALVH